MINTVNIKQQQLEKGYFQSGSGETKVLIMGSCRVAPYCNYLEQWNEQNGNRFTIYSIDPFNWNWNDKGERVDYEAKLLELESYQPLLDMLKTVDIFISEYYANAGMFNVDRNSIKRISNFGLKPKQEIFIPNWNDLFVLVGDIVSFDMEIRKMAIQDYNVIGKLSEQTIKEIQKVREYNLEKFYFICKKTSFPNFADLFKANYKTTRFFFNSNHVSKYFTMFLFEQIMAILKMKKDIKFLEEIGQKDMFSNNYTCITEYDDVYWNEERKQLKEYLF